MKRLIIGLCGGFLAVGSLAYAQGGPYSSQIQSAIRNLLSTSQTITGTWTFSTPPVGSGAPADATYITQTANSTLSAEQALSTLATGLVNVTTTTGVLTSFAPTDDNLLVGSGTVWVLKALTSCSAASSAVSYNTTTNAFGCNTVTIPGDSPSFAAVTNTSGTYLDTSTPTSITNTSASSCGTTAATFSTGASNSRGSFIVGATAGSDCTLTFSTAAAHAWVCSPSDETTAVLVRAVEVNTTSTKFQGVMTAGDKIGYICAPY